MDGAFFNKDSISLMEAKRVRFTVSVPFARFTELKNLIQYVIVLSKEPAVLPDRAENSL